MIVQDSHTVVIGGLIDSSLSFSEYKVPCIGDVPGLGWLFKAQAKSRAKTNLYVFLTPHVFNHPNESEALNHSKQEQMDRIQKKVESDRAESLDE